MSDSMLRIQVRVAARDAAKQLQGVATAIRAIQSGSSSAGGSRGVISGLGNSARVTAGEIKRIERGLLELNNGGSFTTVGKDAAKFNASLRSINKNMAQIQGSPMKPWASQMNAPSSKWSPAIAAREQAKTVAAAEKAAAAAARQAEQVKRAEAAQTNAYLRQMWKQQQRDGAAAKRAEAAAAKQAEQEQRAEAARTNAYLNQIWKQQVREFKAAKSAEERAARDTARELTRLQKEVATKSAAADKAAQKAHNAISAAAGQNDMFGAGTRLAALDTAVNGVVSRTKQGMIQMGKNMQWVGRQINFNFTLPLIAATNVMMKWELANEAAFTRLKKVYGETGQDYTAELEKVRTALRMLSDYYGVAQAQVIELGAQWAAAGLEAGDLAQAVENSLVLNTVGDYQDLAATFDDLITIQSAFNLTSEETAKALATLNTTENMTAATMQDLVTGISKVGGAASIAGVDIRHLSAMMAALVPSTGSAATAGTALQTILSRLMQPTQDIIEILRLMGIEFYDQSFQMLNGSQRLELMSEKFNGLTRNQQAYTASVIASRRQYNKLATLLTDMADAQGNYQRVLDATSTDKEAQNVAELNQEVQTLLSSNPQRLEILKTTLQNLFADIIQPMLPALIGFTQVIAAIVGWFASLNPGIQKAIFFALGLTAAVGILAQMLGSFKLLFGQGISFVLGILRMFGVGVVASTSTTEIAMLQIAAANAAAAEASAAANLAMFSATTVGMEGTAAAAMAGMAAVEAAGVAAATSSAAAAIAAETAVVAWIPILIAAAVVALAVLVYIFWDQISAAFKAIWHWGEAAWKFISDVFGSIARYVADAFFSFPRAVAAAMRAVIEIIASAVKTIREWLSYLNPFARHSPSLVDNVKAGVQVIAKEYASLANSMSFLNKAAQDLRNFADATAAARAAARGADRAEQRKTIVAQSPNAGPAIDALYSDLDALNGILDQLSGAIAEQEAVVAPLKAAYEEADWAVKNFEASMEPLKVSVEALEKAMDVARGKIDDFANTPIQGMKAMKDAIWENEYAQNKLKLEMLKLGDAGKSYDQIKDKLAALQGDLESTQATMTELRQEGAGSDVLQTYQEQLDALEAQKAGLEESGQQALDLQKQLEDLQHAGEILNLEQAVQFDPLIKQIDDLANATQEMSFDDIIAGITEQKAVLDDLTAAYTPQKAALDEQQKTLDELIFTRDQLKAAYDIEDVKLQQLNDTYSQVEDKIKAIEQALSDAATAADALTSAMSGGSGGGGGGVPFGDLTGTDFEQQLEDSSQSIDDFIEQMKAKMGDMDIFKPLKDLWKKYEDWVGTWAPGVVEWLLETWFKVKGWVKDAVMWGANLILSIWNGITAMVSIIYTFFVNLPGDIVTWVGSGLILLGQWASDIITGIWNGLTVAATAVYDFFINLPGDIVEWVGDGLSHLAQWGSNLITGIWNGITVVATLVSDFFINLPGDIVEWVGDGLSHLAQWGEDLITGIGNGIDDAITAVSDFFTELPGDIVEWVGDGLSHLAQWGEDLITGIGDGIDEIIGTIETFFTDLPGQIVTWLGDGIETLAGFGESLMGGMLNGIKAGWNAIADWWNRNLGGIGFEVGGIGISVPDLPKFHEGGVVGGNGEVTAVLRSGEMVLTERQQAALFKMANNSTTALPATQRAGDKTIIFNGDLSFPNITSGDDAETFITNLEMLAGV